MAKPVALSAKEENHLRARVNDFTKKINECMQTRSVKAIKHFWQDHAEEMQALLQALENAAMKKEYGMLDRAMHQTLYKAVLINKSKRLAREMVDAFAENTLDTAVIKKFEKRGIEIEDEMKRMGFKREAQVHSALLRLHIKEEKKEIACRVKRKNGHHALGMFEDRTKEPHKPTYKGGGIKKP